MCAKYGVQTHFKGNKTLRQVLVKPMDQDPKEKKSGAIYSYQLSPDQFNIIGREEQDLSRLIKESIYIRVNNPTLNRNICMFNLSHIWDNVLFSTPDLKTAFP